MDSVFIFLSEYFLQLSGWPLMIRKLVLLYVLYSMCSFCVIFQTLVGSCLVLLPRRLKIVFLNGYIFTAVEGWALAAVGK